MNSEERMKKILELSEQINNLSKEVGVLINSCPHDDIKQPSNKDIKQGCASAKCQACGTDFGWYCSKSPDHICYYYSEEGFIKLMNGSMIPISEGHDSQFETDDSCIFCGHPEERK